jgi:hypothetical protein
MESAVEGLRIVEWLIEQSVRQLGIVRADLVDAYYESSLELLQHQNDV